MEPTDTRELSGRSQDWVLKGKFVNAVIDAEVTQWPISELTYMFEFVVLNVLERD